MNWQRPIDSTIAKQLVDKMYEKRKAAALDLEKYTMLSKLNEMTLIVMRADLFANATNRETSGA